ncbi:SDR family oxidoreductase [Alphaproteobacteria bacterium KMM 3653]|uniref:SDR family oxidoreductase n=1 Tax=Harenicola maris TaxID=2841044 RepID=A0AAP2CQ76_9RHOB|nr:SDR family oxidoreductase [Harenicola maris]
MTNTLLSLGYGYSADHFAQTLRRKGWRIIGTTRSPEKAEHMRASGIEPRLWGKDDLTKDIAAASHILTSIKPEGGEDPVLAAYGKQLQSARPEWTGYLSTIGVYGNHDGAWVDEDSRAEIPTKRASERLAAEQAWQALTPAAHVFRLGGIYGPGRGPLAKIRSGKAHRIIKPGQVFSRIHLEDITGALLASIAAPNPGRVYNLVDDEPAPPQDVLAYAADLLGSEMPPEVPFDEAELRPMARAFYADNKRVRNARLRGELGYALRYPGFREGLKACLAADNL